MSEGPSRWAKLPDFMDSEEDLAPRWPQDGSQDGPKMVLNIILPCSQSLPQGRRMSFIDSQAQFTYTVMHVECMYES